VTRPKKNQPPWPSAAEVERTLAVMRKAWDDARKATVSTAAATWRALERESRAPSEQLLVQLAESMGEESRWVLLPGLPDPWRAEARYVLRENRPVVRDLMIYVDLLYTDGEIPPPGLTSSTLRRLQMGPRAELARDLAELLLRSSGKPTPQTIRSRGLPRKARYTDEDVARFAHDYWKIGPVNPRRALREKYERAGRHVTDSEIAEWIRRAASDRYGYLTKAKGPGDRSPRQATTKLTSWADEHARKGRGKR
jgi:hypothetical protein